MPQAKISHLECMIGIIINSCNIKPTLSTQNPAKYVQIWTHLPKIDWKSVTTHTYLVCFNDANCTKSSTNAPRCRGMSIVMYQWRFVCSCLSALICLSRNGDCCHDSSGQLAFCISRRVLSEPSCCCRYYVFLTLLFVSADGNCDFMLIKA